MPKPKAPISDTELEVLKVLWTDGPATVRDVEAAFKRRRRHLAYNTVLTLLSRLKEKGYVTADRRETAHVFRSVVTRDDLLRHDLSRLAERLCDGTASPLVYALVKNQQGHRLASDEIAELRRLLDDLENKQLENRKP